MARVQLSEAIFTIGANGVVSAPASGSVTVYERAGTALATVYSGTAGTATLANPVSVSDGNTAGYVEHGSYDLVATSNGQSSGTIEWEASRADSVVSTTDDQTVAGVKTFSDAAKFSTKLVAGEDSSLSDGYPISFKARLTYDTPSTNNHIAHYVQTIVKGDWTNDVSGNNQGVLWGRNGFHSTGTSSGDADGLNGIYGELIELDIRSPDAEIGFAIGLQAECAFANAASGSHVGTITSLKVAAPKLKDNAVDGTADLVRGLYLEAVATDALGATDEAYTMLVQGGLSYWQSGTLQAKTLAAADKAVSDTYSLPGGRFVVQSNGAGNDVLTVQNYPGGGQTNNPIRLLAANGTVLWSVNPSGGMKLSSTLAARNGATIGAGATTYIDTTSGTGTDVTMPLAGQVGLRVKAAATPTTDLVRFLSSSNAELGAISGAGHYKTKVNSAPADGDLDANEAAFWFDPTNGTPRLMIKAKQANGTVVTGSVTLT